MASPPTSPMSHTKSLSRIWERMSHGPTGSPSPTPASSSSSTTGRSSRSSVGLGTSGIRGLSKGDGLNNASTSGEVEEEGEGEGAGRGMGVKGLLFGLTVASRSEASVTRSVGLGFGHSKDRGEEGEGNRDVKGKGKGREDRGEEGFHVLDGTESDDHLPLDGDEGVVIDDEACFVDECLGKLDFLSSLPHEISLYILLHLDFPSLLVSTCISRQWRSLSLDNLVWRDLFHRETTWRIKDGLEDTAAAYILPESRVATPSMSRRSSASGLTPKRIILANVGDEGVSGSRLGRRLNDLMADLSGLSLTPISKDPRRPTQSNSTLASPVLLPLVTPASLDDPMKAPARPTTAPSTPGPTRRTSSATLPPLGPVPSPSLATTPSAPLFLDWPKLYQDRFLLDRRWNKGLPKTEWLKGHEDSVYCLQFDETKVITGSRDQTIRVWDIATTNCTQILRGHSGSVLCLQFDDKVLMSGSSDSRILVWDLVGQEGTGKGQWEVKMSLLGHNMGVLDLSFDDTWIVSCSKDTTIRVWHKETGEHYRTLSGHRGPVNAVQLLNNKVVSASGDSLLKLWDVLTGEVIRVFTGHERGLACVQYSPSGKLIATGSNDHSIKIWDAETGECMRTFKGHTDLVRSLAFDEVRRRIVSASYDRTLRLWDLDTGVSLLRFKAHGSLVFDVSFSASKIMSHDKRAVILDFGFGLDVSKFV